MKIDEKHIDEFLRYVLKIEKDSFIENPFRKNEERNKLIKRSEKKLNEVTEKVLSEGFK